LKEEVNSKILRTLPREKAFYFFTSIGNYTGESAASMKEFLEKIGNVNMKSLEFHLYRGDFEKWISETLEDQELAGEIRKLQGVILTGDALRNQLYKTVLRHLKNLTDNPF
jgi:hypothetical protein